MENRIQSLDTRIGKDEAMIKACYNTKYWVTATTAPNDKKRYYFGTEKVTYHQAVDKCKDLCGKLFEPKYGRMDVLRHTPHAYENNDMWIGVLFSQWKLNEGYDREATTKATTNNQGIYKKR
jgi:hypothetical protein